MRYSGLLLVTALLFFACSKEEIQEEELVFTDEFFFAKVNDKDFTFSQPKLLTADLTFVSAVQAYTFKVHTVNDLEETIEFSVTDFKGPGSYYTGVDENKNYCAYYQGSEAWISGESMGRRGMITISEETETSISGTFYFRGFDLTNPVNLKDIRGAFKVYPKKKNN